MNYFDYLNEDQRRKRFSMNFLDSLHNSGPSEYKVKFFVNLHQKSGQNYMSHSVEISEFFCHSDFTSNQL